MSNLKIKPGPRPSWMTMEDRFWEKVKRGDGCWEWQGALSVNFSYGMFNAGPQRKTVKAHRFSWEIHNGKIPRGRMVLHHCDNPACVRPDHLFLGNVFENGKNMTLKERHGRMLFTHDKAFRIRSLYDRHRDQLTHQRIADWFGVSKSTITALLTGRNWKYADGPTEKGIRKRRWNTKLDAEKVRAIRQRRASGEKLKSLSADFGINQSGISKICSGEKWGHIV